MSKVLFIAVHPDDETLGCGGSILKHKVSGDKIYWLIITNIDKANGWKNERVQSRQKEISRVSKRYGFLSTDKLNFPAARLDTVAMNELIKAISKVIDKVKPDIVYLPNMTDIHTDHQITFKAVMGCVKTFRAPFIKRILMYETVSETEFSPALSDGGFKPNVFMNISDFLAEKIEIMKIYKGESDSFPFPRSTENIKALAQHRGATSGFKAAEAFILLKEIVS